MSGLSNRNLLFHNFGGWKVQDQGPARFVFQLEHSPWLVDSHFLLCTAMDFLQCVVMERARETETETRGAEGGGECASFLASVPLRILILSD